MAQGTITVSGRTDGCHLYSRIGTHPEIYNGFICPKTGLHFTAPSWAAAREAWAGGDIRPIR